tara:strand:- start:88 stop:321 length:234 start_codon:yes stop_codon:yes gene_type:complete
MKSLLNFLHSLAMIAGVIIMLSLYLGLASTLAASIINDIQLDTYVTAKTGYATVLFIILMYWIPNAMFFAPSKSKDI